MIKQLSILKKQTVITLAVLGLSACGGSGNVTVNTAPSPTPTTPTSPGTPATPTDPTFDSVRSMAQAEMVSNQSGAVSIAIYQDGEIVYAEAFGNHQWGEGAPVTTNTLFQLGSTTKMFTSLATMQLVDQGMLTTADTLTSTLTDINFPTQQSQSWQDINIQHMMTHQGGFSDEYEGMSDTSELMHYMLNQYGNENPAMVEPGRFFNYSNPNFSYLGAVLEFFGQKDYRDIMEESVFEPLGMTRTTMHKSKVISDADYALGVYQQNNGQALGYNDIEQVNDWYPVIPAGIYTWSTPTELLKMADFLLHGDNDVLTDDLRSEMTESHVSIDHGGLPLNYGYGIFVDDGFVHHGQWYPEKLWQHGGNTDGYTSKFWILPEKNIAVAILSSGVNDNYDDTMMAALQSVTELPAAEALPFAEIDTSTFDNHVGTYDAGFITIEVTNNNGVIMVNVPEMNAQGLDYSRTLTPLGGNTFLANQQNEQVDITFFPQSEDGDSVYIRNRNFVGIKVGSELSERPAKSREMKTSTPVSKIILD